MACNGVPYICTRQISRIFQQNEKLAMFSDLNVGERAKNNMFDMCKQVKSCRFINELLTEIAAGKPSLWELRFFKFGGWGLLFNTPTRVAAEFWMIMQPLLLPSSS